MRARAAHAPMHAMEWARRHHVARHASLRWTVRGTRSVNDPRARVFSFHRSSTVDRREETTSERGEGRRREPIPKNIRLLQLHAKPLTPCLAGKQIHGIAQVPFYHPYE